ncbi:MAG: flagellar biosynthesis anti-sigma factor FlgM [Chloroflexota bacterium]
MRIEAAHVPPVAPPVPRRSEEAPARSHPPAPSRTDTVQISAVAARVRRLERAAQHAPDTRAERVAELKALVQAGAYRVDRTALAERLLSAL